MPFELELLDDDPLPLKPATGQDATQEYVDLTAVTGRSSEKNPPLTEADRTADSADPASDPE